MCFSGEKMFEYLNHDIKNETLYFKAFFKFAIAIGGRLAAKSVHALCVFLCIPLFDCKMRTLRSETSVREIPLRTQNRLAGGANKVY